MQFLLLLFEGKIKTIIIAITISNSNSNNNIFFTITNCYYVSLKTALRVRAHLRACPGAQALPF